MSYPTLLHSQIRGYMFYKSVMSFTFLCIYSLSFSVQSKSQVDLTNLSLQDFIESAYTPTYDCPVPELLTQVEERLATPSLTVDEQLSLSSMKTHSLICGGRAGEAKPIVEEILANQNADRTSRYFLSAIFQNGFIFDMNENPERCRYYSLARDAAENNYNDVFLSASLGYLSECTKNINLKLFSIFSLLESIGNLDDPAALAHAHNRVGAVYAKMGRRELAASQYYKGYEVAKSVYTTSNLLTLLNNAIINFINSNQLEKARESLNTFIELNKEVNTPYSNLQQSILLSSYNLKIKDFIELEKELETWGKTITPKTNEFQKRLFAKFEATMCVHNKDKACVEKFLAEEEKASESYIRFIKRDITYHELLVRASLLLKDYDAISKHFEEYLQKAQFNEDRNFESSNSIDLLQLHSDITNLESQLSEQEQFNIQLTIAFMAVLFIASGAAFFMWRRKQSLIHVIDTQTGLLNNRAIIERLNLLPEPSRNKTNALAIFDIKNFIAENAFIQSTQSDVVLIEVAKTFKHITREADIVGRYAQDQFVICVSDIEEIKAYEFFDRVKAALAKTFAEKHTGSQIQVDTSMSIYCSEEKFEDINDVFKNMLMSLNVQLKKK